MYFPRFLEFCEPTLIQTHVKNQNWLLIEKSFQYLGLGGLSTHISLLTYQLQKASIFVISE